MLRSILGLSLVTALTVTATAVAQGPETSGQQPESAAPISEDADRTTEARRRFLSGLELARKEAWEPALAEFLASIELFRTRAALMNAALCRRQLGRYVEAQRTYQTLLEAFGSGMTDGERQEIATSLDDLSRHIGAITISSEPPGAMVVVDGQPSGVTPLAAPVALNAGAHSVRIFKTGYAALEASVVINGRQTSELRAELQATSQLGTLAVREASGKKLKVLIDGAIVGETPWTGTLSPGRHSVALEGDADLGTAPSVAAVAVNQSTSLVLAAVALDAEMRIEPTPSNARVAIDGVAVGNGVWQGRMPSGRHKVEIAADGHVTVERQLLLKPGRRETLRLALNRDLPENRGVFAQRLYAEVVGGVAWAPNFGADADAACSTTVLDSAQQPVSGCADRSRPFGYLFGARLGYTLAPHLAVELFLGYTRLAEELTRRVRIDHEMRGTWPLYSDDYRDRTSIAGPLAAASAAYRFSDKVPVTVRAWLGVARLQIATSNRGTYRGTVVVDGDEQDVEQNLSVKEQDQAVFAPFFGPEIRVGYRLTKNLVVDAGVLALLLVSGETPRTDDTVSRVEGHRTAALPNPNGSGNLGLVELPREEALGTTFTLLPNIAARWEF